MTAFLDTNIAVYVHDHSSAEKQVKAAAVIVDRADDLVVSTQVLAEFFWVATRRLEPPLPPEAARAATAALSSLPVVSTDAALVLAAIDCAAANNISLWDGMIVSAAKRAGCTEILTEDLNAGQLIDGIRITNPLA